MNKTTGFSELRKRAGLTLYQVASLTGYSLRTVYRWENNETAPKKTIWSQIAQMIEFNEKRK